MLTLGSRPAPNHGTYWASAAFDDGVERQGRRDSVGRGRVARSQRSIAPLALGCRGRVTASTVEGRRDNGWATISKVEHGAGATRQQAENSCFADESSEGEDSADVRAKPARDEEYFKEVGQAYARCCQAYAAKRGEKVGLRRDWSNNENGGNKVENLWVCLHEANPWFERAWRARNSRPCKPLASLFGGGSELARHKLSRTRWKDPSIHYPIEAAVLDKEGK